MSQLGFEHEIAYITARIAIQNPDATISIGTGFFYHASLQEGTDRALILLISNKHIFVNPMGRLIISLNCRKQDGTPEFGNIVTFDQVGFADAYFVHPNPDVDLACVNVSGITRTNAFYMTLSDIFLKPIDYERVTLASNVIFVGYPENRYDIVNNLPLIRSGTIASMPTVNFNGKGQIVIDGQIFPGSSGSPVFVAWEGEYSLLGVVSETLIRHSQLQTLPANMPPVGVQQILGLGIVVKQEHIRELIDFAVSEFLRRNTTS